MLGFFKSFEAVNQTDRLSKELKTTTAPTDSSHGKTIAIQKYTRLAESKNMLTPNKHKNNLLFFKEENYNANS